MNEDVHTLAGAYALDSLGDGERAAFEEHLARCEPCAEEVGGLLATSAVLGRAVAAPPPPRLRERILTEIARTPQDGADEPPAAPRARVPRRRPHLRIAPLLAAACLLIAVAAGGYAAQTRRSLDRADGRAAAIAGVLSAGDARTVTGAAGSGGTFTVVSSAARGEAVVAGSGVTALPGSRTYELWTMGARGVRPAGLVRPGPSGRIAPRVVDVPPGADRVGVTVEPAGGSPQPTTTPITVLRL
ncbi:anti-sigma factor [Actinomadura physcomitrii]|uniref:anti-sigma factor n=1 Tax=Actinomadura physcomitrii TaxID=2650748 RepID=UPI001371A462|nr:anti-sigma factor [Actinomadura physcomitrii]